MRAALLVLRGASCATLVAHTDTEDFAMSSKSATAEAPSHATQRVPSGLATGRVSSDTDRPEALERLEAFIGRWVTEGDTTPSNGEAPSSIFASDIYEWAPGGRFVLHTAYGRIGDVGVGALEIIGLDESGEQFTSYSFDHEGNALQESLTYDGRAWKWVGEHARCTATLSSDGRTFVAKHESSEDGEHWSPSMTVTLRKI